MLGHLLDRSGSSGDLFSHREENRPLTDVMDRISRRYGNDRIFFGGAQNATDAAPMRISFNRIPQTELEDETRNERWLKRLRQTRVQTEPEHRRHEPK